MPVAGVDGVYAVLDDGTWEPLAALAERHDVAGLIAGCEPGLRPNETARFQHVRTVSQLGGREIADRHGLVFGLFRNESISTLLSTRDANSAIGWAGGSEPIPAVSTAA